MCSSSTTRIGITLIGLLLLAAACGGDPTTVATTDDPDEIAIDATTSSSAPPTQTGNPGVEQDDEVDPSEVDDVDQDGIGADDNCPRDFNPAQGDDDGDGIGNVCDDKTDITVDCGFGSTTTSEIAAASGDDELVAICHSITSGSTPPAWVDLGTPILVTDDYLLIDFTPEQLAEARRQGLDAVVVDSIAGRQPADLVELRIEQDPTRALATVDHEVLAEVDPEAIGRVPAEVLAAQPDRTLAAVPEEFWADAPAATLDAVGRDRLVAINPGIRIADRQIAPGRRVELERSPAPTPASTPLTTAPSTSETASPTTSTTRGGDDG